MTTEDEFFEVMPEAPPGFFGVLGTHGDIRDDVEAHHKRMDIRSPFITTVVVRPNHHILMAIDAEFKARLRISTAPFSSGFDEGFDI